MTTLSSQRRHDQKCKKSFAAEGSRGFTLVELLVVIGIIALLISILIPVIDRVKNASYNASTQAEISQISAAITQYDSDFGAFPGPLSNDYIEATTQTPAISGVTGTITGSENLVLGLLGGLNNINKAMTFVPGEVGMGPLVLNTAGNPQRHSAYMGAQGTTLLSTAAGYPSGRIGTDSTIPEFMDRYPIPLPILYLRARVGAPGVVALKGVAVSGGATPTQYDLAEITPYITGISGYTNNLTGVGSGTGTVKANGQANGFVYFYSKSTNTARAVDQFILIGAGTDRIYGTADDPTTFGDPTQ